MTFKAKFLQYSGQEYFRNVKEKAVRNLPACVDGICNRLPTFGTTFTVQNVYLGGTITFDFRVSDLDGDPLDVYFGLCPVFAANL